MLELRRLHNINHIPEDSKGVRFFVKLPNPELPLAIEPAKDPLENSSSNRESFALSSVVDVVTTCLCFNDGEGLDKII